MSRSVPTLDPRAAPPADPRAVAPLDPRARERDRLRRAGLRVTGPRLSVLAVLAAHRHVSVETIAAKVRTDSDAVSTQAIYDVLRVLGERGLVRRIEPAGSPALFEARDGDDHHHLVCRSCARVFDVERAIDDTACLTPPDHPGFAIEQAEVVFWGLCPVCADAASASTSNTDLEGTS